LGEYYGGCKRIDGGCNRIEGEMLNLGEFANWWQSRK